MNLSPRVRLFIVCGAFLTVVFSVWGTLLQPLLRAVDRAVEKLHDTQFELARAHTVLKQRNYVSDELVASGERDIFSYLLQGESPASAVGQLQGIVEPLSRESGLQLESMSAESVTESTPLTKVSIMLKVRGTESALLKLLSTLESHRTLMAIDSLTAIGQDHGQAAGSAAPIFLVVEMRVVGYWARPQTHQGAGS